MVEFTERCVPRERALLFAIPNGGARDPRTGARLKAQGVRAGVADLALLYGDGRLCLIEMKRPPAPGGPPSSGGRQSPEQVAFQALVESLGHRYVVISTLDGYIELLEQLGIVTTCRAPASAPASRASPSS